MSDTHGTNGRSNGNGNRVFGDKTIANWLVAVVGFLIGTISIWQLQVSLDVRERVVRLETVVFPPPLAGFQVQRGNKP